jgi:CheY-like chemotaxis protein
MSIPQPARPRRPFSLLVADDDPIIRDAVGIILRTHGYAMTFAENGTDAWEKAGTEEFDLALVDLNMPGINGFDFIARCRASAGLRNLPVIVITGLSDPEACERAFDLGATSYVTKPLNWALFKHTVWYVLRNEAREAEIRELKARIGMETRAPAPTL